MFDCCKILNKMQEEPGRKCDNGVEGSINRHKPSSEKTQDISHLLANIFKDLYTSEVIGKDTVANLTKSYRRENDPHTKYVEKLQQVNSEYNRRIQEADMLEKHIIQARQKASLTEKYIQSQLMEDMEKSYHHLGLPPVRSTLISCVDNRLLKSHNLICPQDYITEKMQFIKASQGKSMPGFVQPTVSYNMCMSRHPQDDPSHPQSMLEKSEGTFTLSSSRETFSIKSVSSQRVSSNHKMNPEDTGALQKFKKYQNFLRNPHFQPLSHHRGVKSLIMPEKRVNKSEKEAVSISAEAPVPIFIANPPIVLFTDYQIGDVYETPVELRNMTAASRQMRINPPTTPHFSISLGRFPGDGGIVAPGMRCQYTVQFAPDTLADYEDFLVVETQSPHSLIIPVKAHRPPPVLTLPSVLDVGYCLVGGVKTMNMVCCNVGYSAGTFCIMPKTQWPASSIRSAMKACFAEEPPFAISPTLFRLLPGQAEVLEVVFFPITAENFMQSFIIVCDNCHVKEFSIRGVGQLVMLELVAVEGGEDQPTLGEPRDLTADHFIRLEPTNVHSVLQKKVIIKNNTHLELPFQWQIMKPNLQCLLSGETPDPSRIQHHAATDNVFSMIPKTGLLAPAQECVFLLTYCPEELKDYHSVFHLVIMNVPDLQNIKDNSFSHGQPQSDLGGDVISMELEVKGSTEPYRVLLEPYALFIPGEHYIHINIRKGLKMWNHSKSAICFQWECISDCHSIEVEPSSGEIEMNECFDVDLAVTGGRPGCLSTILQCHIQYQSNSVFLPIEVTFKGPDLSVNVPSMNLGLMQLGQEVCSTIQINNCSPLEAQWSLQELPVDPEHNERQVRAEPSHGVLPPASSCIVNVIFRAMCCQSFESVLWLAVLDGTGCHLPIRAEVHRPRVCLLNSQMLLPDLYVGVPKSGKVTLFNQTLLPAHFTWSKLQGLQAHLCSAIFTPSSGTLGPNAYMEINVSFTGHTDKELTVAAVCEVEGMEKCLLLSFFAKAKGLSVSYVLPQTDRATSGVPDEQPVVLDFTEDEPVFIGKSVSRELLITNHTAISASFIIEAEIFSAHRATKSIDKSIDGCHFMKVLQNMSPNTLEKKDHEEFVRGLLAHGKGVAFLVEPEKGTLGPFQTVTINITAYSNMWGDYEDHLICKVSDLEPTLIPLRISVKGCPVYFQMIGPQSKNQNQGPVIRFGTHVSGGDTVSRSLRLKNTSAYDIRLDWLTYNKDSKDRKLIDLLVAYGKPFPLKDIDGNEIVGGLNSQMAFLLLLNQNQSPSTEGSSSSLKSKSETSDSDDEQFEKEEQRARVSLASERKLFSVFVQPHEGSPSDYPYCITPQQIVVPAGGSSTIHLSFTPPTLAGLTPSHTAVGYACGFMSLDSKVAPGLFGNVVRAQGYELEPLRLDMLACVKPAILTVQMEEDGDTLEFNSAASDLFDGHTLRQECVTVRTLQLINGTDITLSFAFNTQWPFSVLQYTHQASSISPSHTRNHAEKSHTLLLPPKHNIQVKVAFHISASLLSYQSQPCPNAPPSVTLLTGENGERRLKFQQSLTIQYSNNSVQSIALCSHLALPMLNLSSDTIDFGICYVGQTRVKTVYLSNCGGSSSLWTSLLDAEEEIQMFRVTPDHGLLKPGEYPFSSSRQALEISFTPSVQESFQTTMTVQGILGEPCLTLLIQGRGSFDERYISHTYDT